jgi:hypothetical protein
LVSGAEIGGYRVQRVPGRQAGTTGENRAGRSVSREPKAQCVCAAAGGSLVIGVVRAWSLVRSSRLAC